mmetsp:Transcript_32045/g.95721  ORF Transcript_32045/g.95721 Transcript_32045/m.95721 type:complete len:242 (+) Transcript_32045:424-1149(+)
MWLYKQNDGARRAASTRLVVAARQKAFRLLCLLFHAVHLVATVTAAALLEVLRHHHVVDAGVPLHILSHARIVRLWFPHEQRRRLAVERVAGVGVKQQLRQEDLKHVDQVKHGAPRLVDHVEAHRPGRQVYVGMEDPVDEADGRRLVRVGLWQLHAYLPRAALVGAVLWAVKLDVELAHVALVRQLHLPIGHHELHDIHIAALGRTGHGGAQGVCCRLVGAQRSAARCRRRMPGLGLPGLG